MNINFVRRTGYASLFSLLCISPAFAINAAAETAVEPNLTLYLPFNGTIEPAVNGGKSSVAMTLKDKQPQFADGIANEGLLTGEGGSGVTLSAEGNLSPEQWTISFWVKGLPNADWNGNKYLEKFWSLNGTNGGLFYFYHYKKAPAPWLYSRRNKDESYIQMVAPVVPEQEWHQWVTTWQKGSGSFLYLDGQIVGKSPTESPDQTTTIRIGQDPNVASPPENNKIIDEFKIYDKVLDAGTIARQYWQMSDRALQPQLSVSPATQKIAIDGNINASEWQNAAGFSGLVDSKTRELSVQHTRGEITYDHENLYVAMRSENPPEARQNLDATVLHGTVKRDAVKHDGDVQNDDHFYLELQPPNGKKYTILINGINTIYDAANGDASWDSGAIVKSNAGVDDWTMEAAIPLKSLGVQNPAGTMWHANFGRVWKQLRQGSDIWEPNGSGTIQFGGKTDAVANVSKFTFTQNGAIDAAVNLYNPSAAAKNISVELAANEEIIAERKVLLEANKSQSVELPAIPKKANGALISIVAKDGEKVLFRQAAPLIMKSIGQTKLWKYPSLQKIRIGWELATDAAPNSLRMDAEIKDASGKIAQKISQEHLKSLNDSVMADVQSLPDGKYEIDVKISDGAETLQQQTLAYDKKPLPVWFGNTLGISDAPPAPWTDVNVDAAKDVVSIWGRTYDYAQKLLPAQIVNQGKEMLAAPMRFVVESNGHTQSSSEAKAQSQWTKITATRADTQRNQQVSNVEIKSNSYTEFDGMTWNEFSVTPRGKVLLSGLTLEIPLKKGWAELIRPYNDYRLQETGVLPQNGWKGIATKMPWVGNGDGGIQTFQEQIATWIGSKTTEVIPQSDGGALMRIHIVDKPTTLDKPLTFSLGWMASPVKAAPHNFRNWRVVSSGGVISGEQLIGKYLQETVKINPQIEPIFPWWQSWWKLPADYTGSPDHAGSYVEPRENISKDAGITEYHGMKIPSAAYSRLTGEVGTYDSYFDQFGDEWAPNISGFTPNPANDFKAQKTIVSQSAPSLRDYYVWGYDQLMQKSSTKALYFDVSRPVDDTNIYHGAGVQMPDGTIEPTRNILGIRESLKRIYTMLKQRHPDGILLDHMSGEVMLPIYSFTDAMVDGENYGAMLDRKDNRGYEKVLSVDQFRTEYSGQNNYGPGTAFLPQFERAKSINKEEWDAATLKHLDYVMGLIFLHDSNLYWAFAPYDHIAKTYATFDAAGVNTDWNFVPYWRQKYFSTPSGVYASFYESPDGKKVLLVAMNTSGTDQQITIPKTLDKSTFTTAKILLSEQPLISETLSISNNEYKVVLLEK